MDVRKTDCEDMRHMELNEDNAQCRQVSAVFNPHF
jgi:hypothetical protein